MTGKVALITGGNGGLGRAMAIDLARLGATVSWRAAPRLDLLATTNLALLE